VLSRIRTVDVS